MRKIPIVLSRKSFLCLQKIHQGGERIGRTKHQMKLFAPTDSVVNLRSGIADFKQYYNYRRPHQSLVKIIHAMKYGIAV